MSSFSSVGNIEVLQGKAENDNLLEYTSHSVLDYSDLISDEKLLVI